jgi:purine-binding chemotaxis protein CheW
MQKKDTPQNSDPKTFLDNNKEVLNNLILSEDNHDLIDHEKNIRILKNRMQHLAKPRNVKVEEEEITIIEFSMSFETYGIEYSAIREIFPLKEIVPIPCTPTFILGITNIRGQILSVIDLKKLFELPERGISDMNKIIIIKNNEMEFGLLADSIIGVKTISVNRLQRSLPTLNGIREKYLMGISSDLTILLDANKMLKDTDLVVSNNKNEN